MFKVGKWLRRKFLNEYAVEINRLKGEVNRLSNMIEGRQDVDFPVGGHDRGFIFLTYCVGKRDYVKIIPIPKDVSLPKHREFMEYLRYTFNAPLHGFDGAFGMKEDLLLSDPSLQNWVRVNSSKFPDPDED